MRFLIAGSGAVGCYFGATLLLGGHDVSFVARGAKRAALAQHGLRVASGSEEHHLPISFADTPQDWDIVMLCVKSWQVEETLAALPVLPSWRSAILTTQNGVDAPSQAAAMIGNDRVLAGIVHGFFEIDDDAQVRHIGVAPKLICNALNPSNDSIALSLRDALVDVGIACEMPYDIMAALWEKHLLSSALGGVGTFTGLPVGETRTNPRLRDMIEAAMREVATVAQAVGVKLPPDIVDKNLAFIDRFPADATTSMQRDIMAGRPSEFDAQTGAVVRMAETAGVAAPVNRSIYDALLPREQRARNG